MHKGTRVITPLGAGVIEGFESFDINGMSEALSASDTGGRIVVALDTPGNWLGASKANPNPYFFRSEVDEV